MKMKHTLFGLLVLAAGFLAAAVSAGGDGPGNADPGALTPTVHKPVPEEWNEKKRAWQGIPSIEATSNERVWIVWYSGGRDEGPYNYLLMATSGDGGADLGKAVHGA